MSRNRRRLNKLLAKKIQATEGIDFGDANIVEAELELIDGLTAGTVTASKALVVDANKDLATLRHVTISGNLVTGSTTLSEAELGVLDGVTPGTVTASKALVVDANKDLATLRHVTLNGNLVTGSTTLSEAELGFLDGASTANSTASLAAILDASKFLQTNANNGTPGTNVTAVHYGDGINVRAVLTLTNVALTVGNSENLAVGVLIYTLPAGNISVNHAYMELDISGVSATSDTPDVGLGTVIGTGVVTVLGGTATFEDIITGQTATDTNGTATIAAASPTLNVLTGGAHTVHFNAAAAWSANADADGVVNGTVVLDYTYNAA